MRVVTNQRRLSRNRTTAQVLFFASLIILIGGFIFTNTLARDSTTLMVVPCLVMPLGLVSTIFSVRLTNQYVRQPHPEDVIRENVKGVHKRSILYQYLLPVHHVLVSPQGIYTFTTRFQETEFKVQGDKWYNLRGGGPFAPFFLFLKQEALGDPFGQAKAEAKVVQDIVDKAAPGAHIKVQPVVVFTSPKATLDIINPALPVVYGDLKKKPSLKNLLRDEKNREDAQSLTPQQITAIDDAIMSAYAGATRQTQSVEEA